MSKTTTIMAVIKKLEEEPLEMVSQKAVAGWLQANYLKLEKQTMQECFEAGGERSESVVNAVVYDGPTYPDFETFYSQYNLK